MSVYKTTPLLTSKDERLISYIFLVRLVGSDQNKWIFFPLILIRA